MATSSAFSKLRRRMAMAALVFALTLPVVGQSIKMPVTDADEMLRLRSMPGRLLARGSNQEPAGEYKLRSFVLEELNPARPLQAEIDGQKTELRQAWRLTITGGPFEIRNMPAMIWIGDTLVGVGVESPDLARLSVIIFDRSLLREGATLSVSYGEGDPQRSELPEKLKLNSVK
jgi:hypothetical protein